MRALIIKKQASQYQVEYIIPHHHSIYRPVMIKYTLLVVAGIFVHDVLVLTLPSIASAFHWIFGVVGIFVFAKCCIDFLNLYLDTIIITRGGVLVFAWDGLLQYKTDFFDRSKVEMVRYEKQGFRDMILQRGSLLISLEPDIAFRFDTIENPQKQMQKILLTKEKYSLPVTSSDHHLGEYDKKEKIDAFVETLGDVLIEYMEKKQQI
jgi:putative NIF3 family GTP cyclohydrolase 1 type 2